MTKFSPIKKFMLRSGIILLLGWLGLLPSWGSNAAACPVEFPDFPLVWQSNDHPDSNFALAPGAQFRIVKSHPARRLSSWLKTPDSPTPVPVFQWFSNARSTRTCGNFKFHYSPQAPVRAGPVPDFALISEKF